MVAGYAKPVYPAGSTPWKAKPRMMPPRNIAGTATMLLRISSAIPDSPCPEVHPLPIRLPKIIKKPPTKPCHAGTPTALPKVPVKNSQKVSGLVCLLYKATKFSYFPFVPVVQDVMKAPRMANRT